jgi:alpha-tubulin suppressor-like RCC1 family protein
VRCWGASEFGQLGYGNTDTIGDDETPASAGDVPLGAPALHIGAGIYHTCAVLTTRAVRCWGRNDSGQLGYGNTDTIGDDETPASEGDVDLGGPLASALSAGFTHTCTLLRDGHVRCWGSGFWGRLGYGNTNSIGDDETPASVGDVFLGGTAIQIAAGDAHNCALLAGGNVRCWGANDAGQLGYGNTDRIGDDETPASAGPVQL